MGLGPAPRVSEQGSEKLPRRRNQRRTWSTEEDDRLRTLVNRHGTNAWAIVSQQHGTRSHAQCRERWQTALSPDLNLDPWSEEEDALILRGVATIGKHWSRLQRLLPGRSSHAIKNRYRAIHLRVAPAQAEVPSASNLPLGLGLGAMPAVPMGLAARPAASPPAHHSPFDALSQAARPADGDAHLVDQLVDWIQFVDTPPADGATRARLVELLLAQLRQFVLDPSRVAPARASPQPAADVTRWAGAASSSYDHQLAQQLQSVPPMPDATPSALHLLNSLPRLNASASATPPSAFNSRLPDMPDMFDDLFGSQFDDARAPAPPASSFNPRAADALESFGGAQPYSHHPSGAAGISSLGGAHFNKAPTHPLAQAGGGEWNLPHRNQLATSMAGGTGAGGGGGKTDPVMMSMIAHRLFMQQQLRAAGVQSSHGM